MIKNSRSKRFWGTLLVLVVLFVTLIPAVSAYDFDNFKYEKDKTFDGIDVAGNALLEKYKPIEIKNMFGLGSILFEGYIDKHDETCGTECSSTIKVKTKDNAPLIDDVKFLTLLEDESWVEQPIRNYQFYINTEGKKIDVNDYEWQCEDDIYNPQNNSWSQRCSNVLVGTHKEDAPTWTPYNVGDEIEGGTYEIKLVGEKKPSRTVDWQIKTNGEWLDEWATWGSIPTQQGEVILNSPANGATSYTPTWTANATATVTGGAVLTNMSLWTNETGSWARYNETTYIGIGDDLVAYYPLNETSGVVVDYTGNYDATNNGATRNVAGLIDKAFTFGASQYVNYTNFPNITNELTACAWLKFTGVEVNQYVLGKWVGGNEQWLIGGTAGNLRFCINGAFGTRCTGYGVGYNDSAWHHFCARVNTTNVILNVDDTDTYEFATTYTGNLDASTQPFYIGNPDGSSDYIGSVDEVGIWNRSLSDSEITALYNSGSGAVPSISSSAIKTWNRTITNGIIWNVQACDSDGDCGFSTSNYTLGIDATAPTITLQYPTGTINYGAIGQSETLNVTFTDTNLASCWYNYNGTNITIAGCVSGVKNSTTFTLESVNNNMTIWANDSVGNYNGTFYSWNYNFTLVDSYYNPTTISGATNPFNITVNSSSQVTVAYLNYQGTNNLGSISSDGTTYYIDKDKIAPGVASTTNITFYWNLTFASGAVYAFSEQNQSVSPVTINSTCTGMYPIYNLTLVDELTQVKINGTSHNSSIKVDLDLYTSDRSTHLKDYYAEFKQTNPVAFCIDNNLSSGEKYSLDLQIQYSATNYSTEIYNIYNFNLNSSSLNQNITLYDLSTANAQNFKLLVRDTSYLPINGALIEIQRKYIENGTFFITEIPKTDAEGLTSASLQLNDVIYKFNIYDSGVLISSFDNVLAICQTPLVSTCTIDFNAILTGIDIPNYEYNDDFNFTLGYNSTTKIVTSTFLISSGEPSTILLEVIREDSLGTAVCQDTLTSASGTLSCTIPVSFGNSTVLAKVYKSGIEQGRGNINLNQKSSDIFGPILVILSLFVMLTLVGIGISDNPIISGVFLFVGVLLLFAMNLVSNSGFIGATSTFLFLGIAIILIIVKAGRRT